MKIGNQIKVIVGREKLCLKLDRIYTVLGLTPGGYLKVDCCSVDIFA